MNPVTYALQHIRWTIPADILQKTFLTTNNRFGTVAPISLDARIRSEVIESRVLQDCNLVGGTEVWIALERCPIQVVDDYVRVYRIPKSMTQNRTITSALSVSYGEGAIAGITSAYGSGGSALVDAAASVMASVSPIPVVASAYVSLIGENTVMIQDNIALPVNLYLRCWVENDANLNHIKPTSYIQFAKLVEYAVKAYVYINNQIPMDRAYIHAGAELGRFKDVVDSYSDANENYQTYLNEVWRRVALLNDPIASQRHLKMLLGGGQ
jgi:hypothetical protein